MTMLFALIHSNSLQFGIFLIGIFYLDITRLNTTAGDAIWSLANSGLDFLDSRTEFWRQQKPIYARKNSYANNADTTSNNPLNYVIKRLETIDTCNLNTN